MVLSIFLVIIFGSMHALNATDQLAEAYNKITDGLITIRKQFPTVQPRVYSLLDQVDKLYKTARQNALETADLKKKLQERQSEAREQIDAAKKLIENTKTELAKKFEEQGARLQTLQAERDQLLTKVSLAQVANQAPKSAINTGQKSA